MHIGKKTSNPADLRSYYYQHISAGVKIRDKYFSIQIIVRYLEGGKACSALLGMPFNATALYIQYGTQQIERDIKL